MMPLTSEQRLAALRDAIRADHRRPEAEVLSALTSAHAMDEGMRSRAARRAADLVETIRAEGKPALMEAFLAEYGLGSTEGLALMGMAEALLRVPDAATADALIADKILPGDWINSITYGRSHYMANSLYFTVFAKIFTTI